VADYDVRRVVGQKPKASLVSLETTPPSPVCARLKKPAAKSSTDQTSIEFAFAPAELGDHGENA
jgi:hypothetical protein